MRLRGSTVIVTGASTGIGRETARLEEFGRLDILVNNAGIGLWATLADGSMENIRRVFEVYVTWFDRFAAGPKGLSPRFIDWGMRRFWVGKSLEDVD